ncbi:MAG: UDP-3-O-(3-hydroxymyristoyl)glucosamine N-acyltransferase [Planctomycetota bacterium]
MTETATTETVGSLARLVGGEVHGDAGHAIAGVGDLRFAGADRIGFLRDLKLTEAVRTTNIGALLVENLVDTPAIQVVVRQVDVAFARIAQRFHPTPTAREHRVSPAASVDPSAVLAAPVEVGPCAVIGRDARVGPGTVVGAGVVIGEGCSVGRDCVLHPRVVLYPGVTVGDRVILQAGAVVGSDGFGYARDASGTWIKWPQLGSVRIEDDVEIGANVAIDRAALGITRIGRGCKIDNLVHIGHNCALGEHVAIAGLSALSGTVTVGDRTQIGGHTVVGGHLSIDADVRIGGNSAITSSVVGRGDYMGFPLMDRGRWARVLRTLGRLPELAAAVRGRGDGRRRRPDRPRQ